MTRLGPLDRRERAIRLVSAGLLALLAWGYGWDGVIGIGALVLAAAALATGLASYSPADAALARVDGGTVPGGTPLRDPRLGFVWLAARLWLGWVWLDAGWEKITDSAWVGNGAPAAIDGFFQGALEQTGGAFPAVPSWYAWLIEQAWRPADTFFSYLIAIGEFALGIALILGLFTGLAAFFGAFMNLNFMLAGALGAGENPIMLGLSLLLLFAGSAAYVYGIDRVFMPALVRRLRVTAHWVDRHTVHRHPLPSH